MVKSNASVLSAEIKYTLSELNPPSVSPIPSPEIESDSRGIFKTVILTEVFISEASVSLYNLNTAGNLP